MSKSSSSSRGVVFLDLLASLFIGLKLTGYITWSWLWGLSPLWIPLAIFLVGLGLFLMTCILFAVVSGIIAFFATKK
jgi:hypothetical protein